MTDPAQPLKDFRPKHEFFIGIDSDGCAFDTMEIKQKECFTPNVIKHFGLQPVSKYAREAAEFVNLYSKTRGCNRFLALIYEFDLLRERAEVKARGFSVPELSSLRAWSERETKLANPTLAVEVEKTGDAELKLLLDWSEAVNAAIADMVHNVPPYPGVLESLEKAEGKADMIVVSATPSEALEREWREHDIGRFVEVIAGQEMGSKKEHLGFAAKPHYPSDKILMIGDAPGDRKAAKANAALFYPINPGHEEDSWARFKAEGLDRFLAGNYAGDYEAKLIEEFEAYLPEHPAW